MSSPVVVIEAPGKKARIRDLLSQTGLPYLAGVDVMATGGHFIGYPKALDPLGMGIVGDRLSEIGRGPLSAAYDQLVAQLQDRPVFLATDDDQEGDVIAADVWRAAGGPFRPDMFLRVRFHSLDAAGIRRAFDEAAPFNPALEAPGRARAMADRFIGWAGARRDVTAGRVITPLLASLAADPPKTGRVHLQWPAADRGPVFTATVRANDADAAFLQEVLDGSERLPMVTGNARYETSAPMHTGDLLVAGAMKFGRPVAEVYDVLQEVYSNGLLSYPRSAEHKYGAAAIAGIDEAARAAGMRFQRNFAEQYLMGLEGAHESPRLMDPVKVAHMLAADDVSAPIQDRLLALVGRTMLDTGRPVKVESGTPPAGMHPALASLDWTRERPTCGPSPWRHLAPGWHPEATDVLVLRRMLSLGLGRPSTWAAHTARIIARGMVDAHGVPVPRARSWIAAMPDCLADTGTARRLADGFDALSGHWEHEVLSLLETELPDLMDIDTVDDLIAMGGKTYQPSSLRPGQTTVEMMPDTF